MSSPEPRNVERSRPRLWDPLVLRLSVRLARSRLIRRLGVVPLATSCAGLAVFVSLSALSLSAQQTRERDFGLFDASASIGVSSGPSPTLTLARDSAILDHRGLGWAVTLLAQVDAQPPDPRSHWLNFNEGRWNDRRWAGRYILASGRWPSKPGEVAVSPALSEQYPVGSDLTVLSGHGALSVVGIVEDRYVRNATGVLAAPGTWASFDWAAINPLGVPAGASQTLYWSDPDPLSTANRLSSAGAGFESLQLPGSRTPNWMERVPIAYRIPSVLLAVGAVLAAYALARRHQHRRTQTLLAVGVPARQTMAASTIAVGVQCVAGVLLGVVLGTGMGAAVRPLLNAQSDQPLSPLQVPVRAALEWLIITVLTCAIAGSMLQRTTGTRRSDRLRRLLTTSAAVRVRRVALWTVLAGTVVYAWMVDSLPKAMWVLAPATIIAMLAVPDLVAAAARRPVPESWGPRRRLIARHLAADTWRPGIVIALTVVALGPGVTLPILTATVVASENDRMVSSSAPGQLQLLGPNGGGRPQPAVVDRLRAAAPSYSHQVSVYNLGHGAVSVSLGDGSGGLLFAVDDVADADALSNHMLSGIQRHVLAAGGVLVWDGHGGDERTLYVQDSRAHKTTTPTVNAVDGDFEPSWQAFYRGVMLRSAAGALDLPTSFTIAVFTDLKPDDGPRMTLAVFRHGLDVSQVYVYRPPIPFELPLGLQVSTVGAVLLLLAAAGAVAFLQVRTLRPYGNRLLSLGLDRRWIGAVMGGQVLVLTTAGAVLALVVVVVPVLAASSRVPNVTIQIPTDSLLAVAASFIAVTLTMVLLASRRLATGSAATD